MPGQLPPLRQVPIPQDPEALPRTLIRSDSDVQEWRLTQSYRDYTLFLQRLNEAVVGRFLPWEGPEPSEAISKTIQLLDTLDRWTDEIPPLQTTQRFGNLAFRIWGKRLEERAGDLLETLLPGHYAAAIPFVKPYLLISFGSFIRMDYGTGHEAAFTMFLTCLTLIRFYQPLVDEERNLVLVVFLRYMRLCWRLQDTYRLEPAGSHGVWGLDDSSFLGYIFGSGQLREQTEIPVSGVLEPSLPDHNLYFMCIKRIHEVKKGPFHEHSSQLYSIATGVPNWGKVNGGLFKMYEAEVLGKRVVVQHIPLGGLLEWDGKASSASALSTINVHTQTTTAPWVSLPASLTPHSERDTSSTFTSTQSWSTRRPPSIGPNIGHTLPGQPTDRHTSAVQGRSQRSQVPVQYPSYPSPSQGSEQQF